MALVDASAKTNATKRREKRDRNKRAVNTSHLQAGQRRSPGNAGSAGAAGGNVASNDRFAAGYRRFWFEPTGRNLLGFAVGCQEPTLGPLLKPCGDEGIELLF